MPDEATQAPADEQDKPTNESPQTPDAQDKSQETDTPEPFSEKFDPAALPEELLPAYKQLQAAATRKFQEAASLRQPDALAGYLRQLDPQSQEALLREIGIELTDDDDSDFEDDDFADPDEELRQELQELKEWKAQVERSQSDAEVDEWLADEIDNQLDSLSEATGREFDEKEALNLAQIAFDRAIASGSPPDVKAVYEAIYTELLPNERKRWVKSKRAPQAPRGAAASHQPDLDDREQRREWIAAQLRDDSL